MGALPPAWPRAPCRWPRRVPPSPLPSRARRQRDPGTPQMSPRSPRLRRSMRARRCSRAASCYPSCPGANSSSARSSCLTWYALAIPAPFGWKLRRRRKPGRARTCDANPFGAPVRNRGARPARKPRRSVWMRDGIGRAPGAPTSRPSLPQGNGTASGTATFGSAAPPLTSQLRVGQPLFRHRIPAGWHRVPQPPSLNPPAPRSPHPGPWRHPAPARRSHAPHATTAPPSPPGPAPPARQTGAA